MSQEFNSHTVKKPSYEDTDCTNEAEEITSLFASFASDNNISDNDYQINYALIGNVCRRTHRRLTQFEVFHDFSPNELPSELKETAILAFWIVKLKPFTLLVDLPDDSQISTNKDALRIPLNERFARTLIFCALQKSLEKENPTIKFDKDLKKLIDYAFRFWDFTVNAISY